ERPATDVHPMEHETLGMQHRHNVERQIDKMHEPAPGAERQHEPEIRFNIDAQQRQEGHEEMAENDDQADIPPGAALAENVPERFLGNVAVPNDEILRESDVSIKHREGEQNGADEIILVLVEDLGEDALAIEHRGYDVGGGEREPGAA